MKIVVNSDCGLFAVGQKGETDGVLSTGPCVIPRSRANAFDTFWILEKWKTFQH